MPEDMQVTPLLDGLMVGEPITNQEGIQCCPAMEAETEKKYIIKILNIPASQIQVDALLLTGICPDKEAADAYFSQSVDALVQEAELLQRLSKLEGFVGFEGWQIEPFTEGTGYRLYIKSAYRPTFERYLSRNCLTKAEAMDFAMDLCAALTVARQSGYIYISLKPGNIYRSEDVWCIGDLGFVATDALSYTSLPEKYRSIYTAPEVSDAYSALSDTMDVYALGLILYQIYNNGQLPTSEDSEHLPAPAYADYELAEIILKACHKNPTQRWQTPAQLGQALAAYRQEFGADDMPIIPPTIVEEFAEEPIEVHSEQPAEASACAEPADTDIAEENSPSEESAEEAIAPDPELEQFTFLPEDETHPSGENAEELEDTAVTEEVSEMLAQADDLIAHETPDPVIPPDPIDVPIPPPLDQQQEEASQEDTEESSDGPPEAEDPSEAEEAEEAETSEDRESSDAAEEATKPKRPVGWLITGICAVLVLLLIVGGWFFYQNYYIQSVEGLSLSGDEDYLTVTLTTEIDNSLLTVVCTDTYGNSRRVSPENNIAYFQDLAPDTQYKVTLEISGLHSLVGTTTDSYTTPSRTEIIGFNAVTGDTDGSAILRFDVEGRADTAWRIRYTAEDQEEKSLEFAGNTVTVRDLTVGTTYTFYLEPVADIFVVGTTTLEHTASTLIFAENVKINSFVGGNLQISWAAPEGVTVSGWTVRCYNEEGFDKRYPATQTALTIEGLDSAKGYTVDVCADGMHLASGGISVSPGSITVTELKLDTSKAGSLGISWTYESAAQVESWLLLYTVNGSSTQVIQCKDASASLPVLIPGGKYVFTLQSAASTTVFGGTAEYTAPGGETFSGYNLSAEHLDFNMCRIPNWNGWTRYDIEQADYTDSFVISQRAGFVIQLTKDYTFSRDQIQVLFVIRDSAGSPVSLESTTVPWSSLCTGGYGTLNIPVMPTTAGSYSISIYFNSALAHSQNFTIQ